MPSPSPSPSVPPQANDPAVLPGGRIVPRYVPPPAGSDQFRIDLNVRRRPSGNWRVRGTSFSI